MRGHWIVSARLTSSATLYCLSSTHILCELQFVVLPALRRLQCAEWRWLDCAGQQGIPAVQPRRGTKQPWSCRARLPNVLLGVCQCKTH